MVQMGLFLSIQFYELTSYAEGMSELTFTYFEAAKYIKPEYLPSVLNYNL